MNLEMCLLVPLMVGPVRPEPSDQVSFQDLSVEVDGQLIDTRMIQVTGDERLELVLVTRSEASGQREILIYTQNPNRASTDDYGSSPWRKISVFDDVIAYSFANVRDDPGQELLYFTRSGIYALSPAIESMRGNVRKLITLDMVFEVPDKGQLPFWKYVLRGDLDSVLVPGAATFSVWGAKGDGSGEYEQQAEFSEFAHAGSQLDGGEDSEEGAASLTLGGDGATLRRHSALDKVLVESGAAAGSSMLSYEREYSAPALADVNADGLVDVVILGRTRLGVYLANAEGIPARPSRVEDLPEFMLTKGVFPTGARCELIDFDDDGDADLIFRNSQDGEGSGLTENVEVLMFLRNDGEVLIPKRPDQLMKFESLSLKARLADVDADGVTDLVIRKFELPSLLDAVTSLEFTQTILFFPGTGKTSGRIFKRQARMKSERVFDADTLNNAISQRILSLDFSGDGLADLAEVDIDGRVQLRRIQHDSGFFSGESWELESNVWKRFKNRGTIGSLIVEDFNHDGLGDLLSSRGDGVLLLLSKRRKGSR